MDVYVENLNPDNRQVINPLKTLKNINRHIRKYNEAHAAPGALQKYPLKSPVCRSVFQAYACYIKESRGLEASQLPADPVVHVNQLEGGLDRRHYKKLQEAGLYLDKRNKLLLLNPKLLSFGGSFTESNFFELETGDRSIE